MTTLLREELVEASVMRCVAQGLPDYGFNPNGGDQNVIIREAFPTPDEREHELTMTTLAFGFSVDDGGEPAEMGSTLTVYVHTLQWWVFGTEPRFARRVAYAIAHIARRSNDAIPLLDFNQDTDPEIDTLLVLKSQVAHMGNNSPRPWDRYVFTCTLNVRDVSYP